MAALRPGFPERAGRPRPHPRTDLQAGWDTGRVGRAGRLGARAAVDCDGRWLMDRARLNYLFNYTRGSELGSTSSVCEACQRRSQRTTHGIGMMKLDAIAVTIARHRYCRPVPLNTTSRLVPWMLRQNQRIIAV